MPTQPLNDNTARATLTFLRWNQHRNFEFPGELKEHLNEWQLSTVTEAERLQTYNQINANGRAKTAKAEEQSWTFVRFSSMKPRPIRWLWPGYLAEGKLTMLNGEPGHGKSLVTLDIAARITTGKDWPDGTKNELPPSDVLLLTLEEDAEDTILPRFQIAGGNPDRLATLSINSGNGILQIEKDAERLQQLLQSQGGFKLVILDPVLDFTRAQQTVDAEVRPVLNRLVKLAQDTGVAVLGINHLNKKTDLAALHRVAGAKAWVSVARLNFLLGKGEDRAVRHICPLKMNVAADGGGSLDYTIEAERFDIPDDRPGINVAVTSQPRVIWRGKGAATVDTITKAGQPKEEETDDILDWLVNTLQPAGEWKSVQWLKDQGQVTGYSVRKIERAVAKLGPRMEKELRGMPAKGFWRLKPS